MPYRIRKIFKFEGSHALSSCYSSECHSIHGHSYVVEVFLQSNKLNDDGMIIDFKMLKEKVQGIFNEWDHALVCHENDNRDFLPKISQLVMPFNPTAENMAKYFYDQCKEMTDLVCKVRVHETATGWGEYFETPKKKLF